MATGRRPAGAPSAARTWTRRIARLAAVAGLMAATACGEATPPRPDADWPAGALLHARREALDGVLSRLASLERTPLARAAERLRAALPACGVVAARADAVPELADALGCADEVPAAAGLGAWRADADLALAIPLGPRAAGDGETPVPRLLVRARRVGEDLHVALEWSPQHVPRALAALLPGTEPAGPPVLSRRTPLLHARVRADGPFDLAALVPAGSQGDELFRLKGELLGAAVLDGSWELALYPPRPERAMPGVALALGVRARSAAAAAADRLLDDVEQHWSIRRTPLERDGDRGACLLTLNLLPELAPCYLATRRALVLAWNPPSLERALADPDPSAAPPDAPTAPSAVRTPAVAFVDLDALHTADRQLASLVGEASAPPTAWPWRRIRAVGAQQRGTLRVELRLEAAAPPAHAHAAEPTARADAPATAPASGVRGS